MAQDYYGSETGRKYIYPIPQFRESAPSLVFTTKTVGVPQLNAALRSYGKALNAAAADAAQRAAEYLLEKTLEVTPYDTGVLHSSGMTAYRDRGTSKVGIVYFDDQIAPYAIYVHEDLTKHHKPPTIAKFLQRTEFKERSNIAKIIRDECAKARPGYTGSSVPVSRKRASKRK